MNFLTKLLIKTKELTKIIGGKVKQTLNKIGKEKLTKEEVILYNTLQEQSNKKLNEEYKNLDYNQKEILDKVGIYNDVDKFPSNKIKDKDFYNKQIEKFNKIMTSNDVFGDKLVGDTRAFLDVFGKSKYATVKDGELYNEFKKALQNADPATRYEFFEQNRSDLTQHYQRANEMDNAFDKRQLERTLKSFIKMLNGDIEVENVLDKEEELNNKLKNINKVLKPSKSVNQAIKTINKQFKK